MKKIINILGIAAIYCFVFLFFLIVNSANYLLNYWGEISFSTVLYQLNSPLQGTGSEVIGQYMEAALFPSITETILCIIFYYLFFFFLRISDKITIRFKGRILEYKYRIAFPKLGKLRKRIKITVILICVIGGSLVLWHKCSLVGVTEYIKEVTQASTIFEEEYVAPGAVGIEFKDKKNLLYIYMESMETTYADIESGGGKETDYIPNLKKLAKDNVSFSNTEGFGGLYQIPGAQWTMGALLASTAGVPYKLPIEGNSAGEHTEFLPGITSLGEILENEGYKNYFMCGSDISFGGRDLYFRTHGNYNIFDYYTAIEEDVIPEDYYEFWGMEDSKLYEYAKNKLTEIATKDDNFNFTLLTVDTHHSEGYICEICDEIYPQQYANAIWCADKQIVSFIDWVKEQPWYEDTVVIITGDHKSMNKSFFQDLPEGYSRRIYNCFLNTDLEPKNGTKERSASILDMFPTTLAVMGAEIEGDRLGLGTNLFSDRFTLTEEMGEKEFGAVTSKYSKYYNEKFIKGN